ncbi:MAG TPA: hypothetical protein VL326_36625 [Kofleriaceae bacterium]|nr:hypothetical protein [Kofleriaceae bacterium]
MRVASLILLAGCYRSTGQPTASITNQTQGAEPAALTMTASGVGPIDSTTKVTLTNLRAILVDYEVKPVNDGSLQYDIYRGGERLAYVVPDDQSGLVFNVHAVSSQVAVSGYPWRVGRAFGDAAHLTNCECWGPNPTCYATGEHLAVNFNRNCDGLTSGDTSALRKLNGELVQRVIWSPTAFSDDYGEDRD